MTTDLLGRALAGVVPAFALLHRPETTGPDALDVLAGEISTPDTLAGLPLASAVRPGHELLAIVPYRQITERGFACVDDGAPLIAMRVTEQETVPITQVSRIADVPIELAGEHFDVDDDTYADIVRQVIAREIGQGEGANFVIKRSFVADIG
ncbi:MAG TPA: phenazine-specific anthranilate synthase component I, partial [Pseudonocardiaceae bacterium]|nr:phenazine-specific anthranilate synthase component I [Pseudonocardiaceae bacterium]